MEGIGRAFAVGYGADKKILDKPIDPEKAAAELNAWNERDAVRPIGRWSACVKLFGDVAKANAQTSTAACLDTIPVCGDDRGGPDCCPAACIESFRRRWKELCPSGKCDWHVDLAATNDTIMKGSCIPGFAEEQAQAAQKQQDWAHKVVLQQQSRKPRLVVGEPGVFAANGAGVQRSTDDGLTWSPAESGLKLGDGVEHFAAGPHITLAVTSYGLFVWNADLGRWEDTDPDPPNRVHFHPHAVSVDDAGILAWSGGPLLRSVDRGRTWTRSTEQMLQLGIDHEGPLTSSGKQPPGRTTPCTLPIPISGGRFIGNDCKRGVLLDADGQNISSSLPASVPSGTMLLTEIQPRSIVSRDGTFFCRSGNDVFSSPDGLVWKRTAAIGDAVLALAITPKGTLLVSSSEKLFRSTDRGASWTVVSSVPNSK